MAVTIPSDKGKPGLPQFKITGEEITSVNPVTSIARDDYKVPAWVSKSGSDYTQQDIITIAGSVDITIIDADGGGNTTPSYDLDGDFVGGIPFNGKTIGGNWEVYYTLNGKNPTRTKAYLYTGPFTLSDNKSGSDNTIIKARAYKNGIWSDVAKIELNIASNITTTSSDPSV